MIPSKKSCLVVKLVVEENPLSSITTDGVSTRAANVPLQMEGSVKPEHSRIEEIG
jgi:hypothetical protein